MFYDVNCIYILLFIIILVVGTWVVIIFLVLTGYGKVSGYMKGEDISKRVEEEVLLIGTKN